MRPRGINLILLLDTSFAEAEVCFLDVGERAENVLFDHLHHFIQVGNDQGGHVLLITQHLLQLIDRVQALSLAPNVLCLVLIVVSLHAKLQLLQERVLRILVSSARVTLP